MRNFWRSGESQRLSDGANSSAMDMPNTKPALGGLRRAGGMNVLSGFLSRMYNPSEEAAGVKALNAAQRVSQPLSSSKVHPSSKVHHHATTVITDQAAHTHAASAPPALQGHGRSTTKHDHRRTLSAPAGTSTAIPRVALDRSEAGVGAVPLLSNTSDSSDFSLASCGGRDSAQANSIRECFQQLSSALHARIHPFSPAHVEGLTPSTQERTVACARALHDCRSSRTGPAAAAVRSVPGLAGFLKTVEAELLAAASDLDESLRAYPPSCVSSEPKHGARVTYGDGPLMQLPRAREQVVSDIAVRGAPRAQENVDRISSGGLGEIIAMSPSSSSSEGTAASNTTALESELGLTLLARVEEYGIEQSRALGLIRPPFVTGPGSSGLSSEHAVQGQEGHLHADVFAFTTPLTGTQHVHGFSQHTSHMSCMTSASDGMDGFSEYVAELDNEAVECEHVTHENDVDEDEMDKDKGDAPSAARDKSNASDKDGEAGKLGSRVRLQSHRSMRSGMELDRGIRLEVVMRALPLTSKLDTVDGTREEAGKMSAASLSPTAVTVLSYSDDLSQTRDPAALIASSSGLDSNISDIVSQTGPVSLHITDSHSGQQPALSGASKDMSSCISRSASMLQMGFVGAANDGFGDQTFLDSVSPQPSRLRSQRMQGGRLSLPATFSSPNLEVSVPRLSFILPSTSAHRQHEKDNESDHGEAIDMTAGASQDDSVHNPIDVAATTRQDGLSKARGKGSKRVHRAQSLSMSFSFQDDFVAEVTRQAFEEDNRQRSEWELCGMSQSPPADPVTSDGPPASSESTAGSAFCGVKGSATASPIEYAGNGSRGSMTLVSPAARAMLEELSDMPRHAYTRDVIKGQLKSGLDDDAGPTDTVSETLPSNDWAPT